MKIYYSKFYNSHPYLSLEDLNNSFDTMYCGDEGLLNILLLYGGIPEVLVSPAERQAGYRSHLETVEDKGIFQESFNRDPYATACKLLHWRDVLVRCGWNFEIDEDVKLKSIRDFEPTNLPLGVADCWKEVLQESEKRSLLPKGCLLTVCQPKESLEPLIETIFDNLENHGTNISYVGYGEFHGDRDIDRIKNWLLNDSKGKIRLLNDGTIEFLKFNNDEEALRYISSEDPGKWQVYYCQQQKRFDNYLRYLGQPVCGSSIEDTLPQVVQLFILGNGLFEYPLNLRRILAWLESPINPLGRNLSHSLAKALSSSGGLDNDQWNTAINDYIEQEGIKEDDEDKIRKKIASYLPFQSSSTIKIKEVLQFNKSLRQWAVGLLSMEEFPYDEIVRQQLRQIDTYCKALIEMLPSDKENIIRYIDLYNACAGLVEPGNYVQYEAEKGCRSSIKHEGNIHSPASSLIWFCINDSDYEPFPFDFLTEKEFEFLINQGVKLFKRKKHNEFKRISMIQTILKVDSLTLVETKYVAGQETKRHPLVIQLQECVEGGVKSLFKMPVISSTKLENVHNVFNHSDKIIIKLEEDVKIPTRKEMGDPDSYSSIAALILHPFDYVCGYLGRLKDINLVSMEDLNKVMGNVAHKIIEMTFTPGRNSINDMNEEKYQEFFDSAIQNCGLLLLQSENTIEYNALKSAMRKVLKELNEKIIENSFTVYGTEFEFERMEWIPELADLSSKADMILTDEKGDIVIFDFKWSYNKKNYKRGLEEGTDMQLSIYKYMAGKQFGKSVRATYILLPKMDFITLDDFKGVKPVTSERILSESQVMQEIKNGVEFRRKQFNNLEIERAEGCSLEESDYGRHIETDKLIPLKMYDEKISSNLSTDYENFR